jgi:hypothetical protein
LPVGTLHSSANHFAEVHNPIPLKHAGAPFPVTVPVNPPALAEGARAGFFHCLRKLIPCFLDFLSSLPFTLVPEFTELDRLSNSVVDLIEEGRLEEAENVCHQLLVHYPDQIDGTERLEAKLLESQE